MSTMVKTILKYYAMMPIRLITPLNVSFLNLIYLYLLDKLYKDKASLIIENSFNITRGFPKKLGGHF